MKSLTKKVAVVAVAVGAMVAGGVAWAYWSASGSGSASATALTAQNVTVAASTGTADLYPGFTAGDVSFTLTNPNPYQVTFSSMTPGTITSSDPTNCPSTNVTVAPASGLSIVAAGHASNVARSIADVVTLATSAPNECQGVEFTIALTLSGLQN